MDATINCAGIGVAFKVYNFNKNVAHSLEDFEKVQRVNVGGTFNVIRLSVGLMGENQPDEVKDENLIFSFFILLINKIGRHLSLVFNLRLNSNCDHGY